MNNGLLTAAGLAVLIAIVHSVLGERYILMRLFRRGELPRLFGSDWFTRRTLRFVWHVTSIAWIGFAALLVLLASDAAPSQGALLKVIAATFFSTALVAGLTSWGRHLSWIVFLAIALLCWWAA